MRVVTSPVQQHLTGTLPIDRAHQYEDRAPCRGHTPAKEARSARRPSHGSAA